MSTSYGKPFLFSKTVQQNCSAKLLNKIAQHNLDLALTSFKLTQMPRLTHVTHVRVQIRIPSRYQQEPIISRLIAAYGLVVNITGAALGENTGNEGLFDLELRGTPEQLRQSFLYLRSLDIKLISKPHVEGDSWNC